LSIPLATRLQLDEFSLSGSAYERLQEIVTPLRLGAVSESPALQSSLREIGQCLPQDFLAVMKEFLTFERLNPVMLHNVPEVPHDERMEACIEAEERTSAALRSAGHWISRALFEHIGGSLKKSLLLVREKGAPAAERVLHRDLHPLTSFTCISNNERAPTVFVDLRRVLSDLTPEEKALILLGESWAFPEMNLVQYEQFDSTLAAAHTHERHWIFLKSVEEPERIEQSQHAIERFNELVNLHALSVTILPGQMLCWHNSTIYHRAAPATVEPEDDRRFGRIVLFTGG